MEIIIAQEWSFFFDIEKKVCEKIQVEGSRKYPPPVALILNPLYGTEYFTKNNFSITEGFLVKLHTTKAKLI